jgi:hypothetical protein
MKKLSVSAAWEETKAVLSRDGRLFIAVALAFVSGPTVIANFVSPNITEGQAVASGAWLVVSLIVLLLMFAGVLALSSLAVRHGVQVAEAVATGFRRLIPFATLVFAILFLIGFFGAALAVGGTTAPSPLVAAQFVLIIVFLLSPLLARLSLIGTVAAIESGGPLQLVRRSWALSQGSTWRLWGLLLLMFVASIILEAATGITFSVVARILIGPVEPWSVSKLVISILLAFLRAFEVVISTVMLARIYVQLSGRGAEASVPSSGT